MQHCKELLSVLMLLGFQMITTSVHAQELPKTEASQPSESAQEAEERRRLARKPLTFDRHENGLDVKMTGLFGRQANLSSPNLLLSAQWNYRFHSETFIGLAFTGMPTQARAPTLDNSTLKYATYSGGFNLAQSLVAYDPFRIVVSVTGGVGVIYLRHTPVGSEQSSIEKPNYKFIEPGIFITFFDYAGVQMGLSASVRRAQLLSSAKFVTNANLTSTTYGLTFRTLFH